LDFSHDPKLRTKLPSKKMEFVGRIHMTVYLSSLNGGDFIMD